MRSITLLAITLLAAYLRFWNLGVPCLWVDEGLFVGFFDEGVHQEFLTVWLYGLFRPDTEFWIRFPFALAGTLTIPAIYLVMKDKRYGLLVAAFVAVFPLFVWWSRMARPYVIIGLLVVLGWRWVWFSVVGCTMSPVALIGARIKKKNLYPIILMGGIAVGMFLIRPDSGRDFFNFKFLINAHRMWYVPILISLLYWFEFMVPFIESRYSKFRKRRSGVVRRQADSK